MRNMSVLLGKELPTTAAWSKLQRVCVCACMCVIRYNIIAKGTGSIFISSFKNIICVNMWTYHHMPKHISLGYTKIYLSEQG